MAAPVEAAVKEVKRLAVSGGGDDDGSGGVVETEAQRAVWHAEVAKALEEVNAEDPR